MQCAGRYNREGAHELRVYLDKITNKHVVGVLDLIKYVKLTLLTCNGAGKFSRRVIVGSSVVRHNAIKYHPLKWIGINDIGRCIGSEANRSNESMHRFQHKPRMVPRVISKLLTDLNIQHMMQTYVV